MELNNTQFIVVFPQQNGYANAPHCYVIRKQPALFFYSLFANNSRFTSVPSELYLSALCLHVAGLSLNWRMVRVAALAEWKHFARNVLGLLVGWLPCAFHSAWWMEL
jgi:hypothetical protein